MHHSDSFLKVTDKQREFGIQTEICFSRLYPPFHYLEHKHAGSLYRPDHRRVWPVLLELTPRTVDPLIAPRAHRPTRPYSPRQG